MIYWVTMENEDANYENSFLDSEDAPCYTSCPEHDWDDAIREYLLRCRFYKNQETDSISSIIDLENIEGLSNREVIQHFENIFGKIESQEDALRIKNFLLDGIEFLEESLNLLDYIPMPRAFKISITNISTREDVLRFLLDAKNKEHVKVLLKVMIAQQHMDTSKNKYSPDKTTVKAFNIHFNSIFKKRELGCKHCFTFRNGNRHYFYLESKSSNGKHKSRILQKMIRKASADLEVMDDILRGRIIVKKAGDVEPIIKRLIGDKSLNLKLKDNSLNGTRDETRQDISLIGKYKGIPVEVQIMTAEAYEKSEEGEKHHLVYEFIQHCIIIERLYGYIPQEYVKDNIYDLSRNNDILKSKIGNNKFGIGALRTLIWNRFNQIFLSVFDRNFYYDEIIDEDHSGYMPPYISYGRTIELKNLEILNFKKERWEAVVNALNSKLPKGLKFTNNEWDEIFKNLEDLDSLGFLNEGLPVTILETLRKLKLPQYYSSQVKKQIESIIS